MAVEPLFLTDMDALKGRLRLAGVETTNDAQSLIDGAARTIRQRFYARLGTARINELLNVANFPVVENPTTDPEVIRAIADEVEAKWVWTELTRNMPVKFYDNSGDDIEQYNQEGIFRSIEPDRIEESVAKCLDEIEGWLPILAGTVELGTVETNKSFIQGDAPGGRIYPLGTLAGQNCRLWGNPRVNCEDC